MTRVLVAGETCLDIYTYGRVSRLAPDKPVPILQETRSARTQGMAGNVHRHLVHFGLDSELLTNLNFQEIIKERFVDEETNHMFLRKDSQVAPTKIPLSDVRVEDFDVLVVSDYDKGFLDSQEIENLCSRANVSFLDTKKPLGKWAASATYIKINEREYKHSQEFIDLNPELNVIKTLGAGGASFKGKVFPTEPKEVIDVSGAGDTFMAALVAGYSNTGSIEDAIVFANRAAQSVVTARGISLP